MDYSGWIRTKGGRWREVARAPERWGPGGCWDLTLMVQVFDDCDRVVLESGLSPGRGAVRMANPAPTPEGLFGE